MKHLIAISAFAFALGFATSPASAQSSPPALPALTQQQMQDVNARMDAYRRATDARVARNEITPDEAARLVQWREWQIAQQVASAQPAPPPAASDRAPLEDREGAPPDYREGVPPDYRESAPPDYNGAPQDYRDSVPPDYRNSAPPAYSATVPSEGYAVQPAPLYAPYYRPVVPYYPYYYGPRPYAYWGPSVCAGGFGRHFGGRICF